MPASTVHYREFLPGLFREIVERSAPDGFADNSWAGLGAQSICACANCRRSFREAAGLQLPVDHDFDDPVYRQWLRWNVARRTEVWQENSHSVAEAGGPHCVWVGMLSGDLTSSIHRFVDLRALARSSPVLFLDHQCRRAGDGFAQNAEAGLRMHALAADEVLIPESTAMYSAGHGFFRATSMPEAEVRTWSASGFAGGIQPWWHHISAVHEDRRQYATPAPIFSWHARHEEVLVDRTPIAQVAVLWSENNFRFHGRTDVDNTGVGPYRGTIQALSRARIPYLPWHLDDLDRIPARVCAVVLPDVAALDDDQVAAIRALVARGVSVVATGSTSLLDGDGVFRGDFALGDVLGVRIAGSATGDAGPLNFSLDTFERHTYARFDRDAAGRDILTGFDDTLIIPLGGRVESVVVRDARVVATHVGPFPTYPPETAWLPPEQTSRPVLTIREDPAGARIVYCAADLDRLAGREHRPDHLRLLANLVRWAVGDKPVLQVDGAGRVDCHLFERRTEKTRWVVVHLVNVDSSSDVPGTHDELIPIGPLNVRLTGLGTVTGPCRLLVAKESAALTSTGDVVEFRVPRVTDHEVIVLECMEDS